MIPIRLERGQWNFDPEQPLGPSGGFGAVFAGSNGQGARVAVKRLHLDAAEAAHRELSLARDLGNRSLTNVIPVLDSGQDAESGQYFVVMPRAERSLQDHIDSIGPLKESEAISILLAIASGLEEAAHLVHRDLKPGNVLWHDEVWKIADFGIARFVEESTSSRTLKDCLSPHFASPEQWRLERASPATDIYALGCIGHALLSGVPPFGGNLEEIREAHLHKSPPRIGSAGSQFNALISMMLRKSPDARPSRSRVAAVLTQLAQTEGMPNQRAAPLSKLAAAAAEHEQERAAAETESERQRSLAAARQRLAADGQAILRDLAKDLQDAVASAVPTAVVAKEGGALLIQIGRGKLEMELDAWPVGPDEFKRSGWDVVCAAAIAVSQESPTHQRSASLWYTRRRSPTDEYRWYEVGYMGNPLTGRGFQFQPTAGSTEVADRAHSRAMDTFQESYPPVAVDGESADVFCDRWLNILAAACEGRLQHLAGGLPTF